MRLIAKSVLVRFAEEHPETKTSLGRWMELLHSANWSSMSEVRSAIPKGKALNADRARFPIAGGHYRLIVAFDFRRQIAFVKFIGTHRDYDSIDALTVSQF